MIVLSAITDEVHKRTEKITTNEEVRKDYEKLENMIEAVVTIRRKDSDKFEGQSKVSTVWFNLDSNFFRDFSTIEPYFYKNLYDDEVHKRTDKYDTSRTN